MTWRIWSPVGRCSSSNASFEASFSSDAASALDEKRLSALHGKRRFSLVARPSQSSPDPSGSETERSQAEFWFWIIATSVGSATNAPAITAAASE